MSAPIWAWLAFVGGVVGLLLIDLLLAGREPRRLELKEAVRLTLIWVAVGVVFGLIIWFAWGGEAAGEYYAGYLVELSLSVDNVFVFTLIFTYFAVPDKYQHHVLFWGIFGALVLRLLAILGGAELLARFDWTIYVFGVILLASAARMAFGSDESVDPKRNPVMAVLRRVVPMTDEFDGSHFFTRRNAKLVATPLLAVLVMLETTDLLFAVDSIPAVLAVTDSPYIAFTSNACAILGLRSMYFILADMVNRFRYLKYGLVVILAFVAVKMLLTDVVDIGIEVTLAVIVAALGATAVISVVADRRAEVTR